MCSLSCTTDYCRLSTIGINDCIPSLSDPEFLTCADLYFRGGCCGLEYATVTSQTSFNRDAVDVDHWMLFEFDLLFSNEFLPFLAHSSNLVITESWFV